MLAEAFLDSWCDRIPPIASRWGRLKFVSSLRILANSRTAGGHLNGDDDTSELLRRMHIESFTEWLDLSLYVRVADFKLYLSAFPEKERPAAKARLESDDQTHLMPEAAGDAERVRFRDALAVSLAVIRRMRVSELCRNQDAEAVKSTTRDWRVRRALQLIESSSQMPDMAIGSACARLRTSPRYFGKLFKRETGLTFGKYLQFARMDQAVGLLNNESLTVQQIAAAVGYTDASNFGHHFRALFGITPRQYRLERRLGTEN